MKKIFLIIMLFLFIPSILAEENYIRKYKYYKLNRVYGPYSKSVSEEFPNMDKEDFIYTDYIESDEMPEAAKGREIIEDILYEYKRIKDVNYIEITNYDRSLNIDLFEVKYKGEKISFTFDGNLSFIEESSKLTIYFDEMLDPAQITLLVKSDASDTHLAIKEGYNGTMYARQDVYIDSDFIWNGYNATYNSTPGIGDIWTTDIYADRQKTSRIMIFNGSINKYKYRDILYHTYREDREYYHEYLTEGKDDFIYRDENDFIDILNIIPLKPSVISEDITSFKSDVVNDEKMAYDLDNTKKIEIDEVIDVPNTGVGYINRYVDKAFLRCYY